MNKTLNDFEDYKNKSNIETAELKDKLYQKERLLNELKNSLEIQKLEVDRKTQKLSALENEYNVMQNLLNTEKIVAVKELQSIIKGKDEALKEEKIKNVQIKEYYENILKKLEAEKNLENSPSNDELKTLQSLLDKKQKEIET